jgi:hypothetical protein
MAIVTQQAAATADASGDAVFMFPDVPVGELWIGTTSIPTAGPQVASIVTTGGQLVGSMQGNGSFGPWLSDHTRRLAISSANLTPHVQYVAVWHADDRGKEFSTYPATITSAVVGNVTVPSPLDVIVQNFPATQPVSGIVDTIPVKPAAPPSGRLVMTGAPVAFPTSPSSVQGVVLSALRTNTAPILFGAFALDAGNITPLLPLSNASPLFVTGTAPDVLTYLII